LGARSPRAAIRLLTASCTKLFTFVAATTPPREALPVIKMFDTALQETFLHVLYAGPPAPCAQPRVSRALARASLPPPRGCGLFRAADHGAVAWLSSLALCLQDELLFSRRAHLQRHIGSAIGLLAEALGGTSSVDWMALDGTRFSPAAPSSMRPCRPVLRIMRRRSAALYLQSVHDPQPDTDYGMTMADVVDASARSLVNCTGCTALAQTY
jgi:hypothetical protein